jgi:large subunit ribosomal protein L22
MIVYSKSNNSRISPRKARMVIDIIKGKNAIEISQMLVFSNKKAAGLVKKVLDTAIANATNNFDLDKAKLIIKEARVDAGFLFKRGKAASKGRFNRILRRNSHIVIGLEEVLK